MHYANWLLTRHCQRKRYLFRQVFAVFRSDATKDIYDALMQLTCLNGDGIYY